MTDKPWADKPREGDPVPGGMTEAVTGQPLSSREEWSGDAATGCDTFEERCRDYLLAMPAWRDINGAQISAEIDRLRAEVADQREFCRKAHLDAQDAERELAAVREQLRQTQEAGDALADMVTWDWTDDQKWAKAVAAWRALRGGREQQP